MSVLLIIIIISSVYSPGLKCVIYADLMNYHTIIVENTQAHYFDNLSDNLYTKFRRYEDPGSVLNNDDTIKFADINTLFIVTYAEPILVFVRTTKWKKDGNLPI